MGMNVQKSSKSLQNSGSKKKEETQNRDLQHMSKFHLNKIAFNQFG